MDRALDCHPGDPSSIPGDNIKTFLVSKSFQPIKLLKHQSQGFEYQIFDHFLNMS